MEKHDNAADRDIVKSDGEEKKKQTDGKKTMWVTVFRCFHCGKHGHNLPKCRQCAQAYYCDSDCQRKHWRNHRPVCIAAVAALARHAHRVSTRAVGVLVHIPSVFCDFRVKLTLGQYSAATVRSLKPRSHVDPPTRTGAAGAGRAGERPGQSGWRG